MKRILYFFIPIVLIACVSVYDLRKIRRSYNQVNQKITGFSKKMSQDYRQKQSIHKQLIKRTSNPELAPYPQMKNTLVKMKKSLDNFNQTESKMIEINKHFSNRFKGKNKIKSNQPEAKELDKIHSNYKALIERGKKQAGGYKKNSLHFNNLIKKHKIGRAETKKVYQKLKGVSKKIKNRIKQVEKQIAGLNKKRIGIESKAILEQIERILSNMKREADEIKNKESLFDEKYLKMQFIYSGPGIEDLSVFVKTKLGKLKGLVNQYNQKVKELKQKMKKK